MRITKWNFVDEFQHNPKKNANLKATKLLSYLSSEKGGKIKGEMVEKFEKHQIGWSGARFNNADLLCRICS